MACFVLKKAAFNNLLGPIEEVWKLEALKKVPILFNLAEDKLQEMAKRMSTASVKAQDVIFREGDQGMEPHRQGVKRHVGLLSSLQAQCAACSATLCPKPHRDKVMLAVSLGLPRST